MDDVQNFHTRSYEKADDMPKQSVLQKVFIVLPILPALLVKTLIVFVLESYYILLAAFHLVVPKKLKDIRGQLAVVGAPPQTNYDIDIQLDMFTLNR